MQGVSEQLVQTWGSGCASVLYPLALFLAEAACLVCPPGDDRLFLFGNRKDTIAAFYVSLLYFPPFLKHKASASSVFITARLSVRIHGGHPGPTPGPYPSRGVRLLGHWFWTLWGRVFVGRPIHRVSYQIFTLWFIRASLQL